MRNQKLKRAKSASSTRRGMGASSLDRARHAIGQALPPLERHPKWAATWRGKGTEDMSGVEPGMRVGVYGNRTVGTFSVVNIGPRGGRGKVVGYGRGPIFLDDAQFVVEASGRERVRREKKRYVHAYVVGTYSADQGSGIETPAPAYYNPFATDEWVRFDDQSTVLKSAPRVMLAFAGDGRPRVVYEDAQTGETEMVEMETGLPPPEQVEELVEDGPDPVLFDESVEDPYEHAEDFFGMPRDARVLSYTAWKTASAWPKKKPSGSGKRRARSVRKVSQDSAASSPIPFEIEVVEDSAEGRDEIHFGAIGADGDALGIVILTEEDYEHEDDLVYRVRFAEVKEELQGKGIGRALYDAVMDWAKEQKVWIAPDNSITDSARKMWHKMRHDPSIRTVHNPDRDWQTMQTHLNPMDAPEGEFMDHYVDMDLNPEDMPTELTRLYRRSFWLKAAEARRALHQLRTDGIPRREGQLWRDYVAGQVEAKVKKYGDRLQLIIEGRLPREDGRVSTVEVHRVGDVHQRPGVGYFVSVYPHFAASFPALADALQTIASRPKARFAGEATAVVQDYVLDKAESLDEGSATPQRLEEDLNDMTNPNRLAQLGEMPFIQDDPPPSEEPRSGDEEGGKTEALVDSILACLDECGIDTGGLDHEELEKKITEHAKDIIGDVMKLQSSDDEDEGEDEHPESIMDREGSLHRAGRVVRFLREGQIAEGIVIDVTPDGTHVDVQLDDDGLDVETLPVGDLMPMEVIEIGLEEDGPGDIADIAEPAD